MYANWFASVSYPAPGSRLGYYTGIKLLLVLEIKILSSFYLLKIFIFTKFVKEVELILISERLEHEIHAFQSLEARPKEEPINYSIWWSYEVQCTI